MADTVSAILQTFSSAVDGFRFLQTARQSRRDCVDLFEQLVFLELRFTRWGTAANILVAAHNQQQQRRPNSKQQHPILALDEATRKHVLSVIERLNGDMSDARKKWSRVAGTTPSPRSKAKSTTASGSGPRNRFRETLVVAAARVIQTRERLHTTLDKVEWVITGRDDLLHLVTGISRRIDSLEEVIPTAKLQTLAQDEMGELKAALSALRISSKEGWHDAFVELNKVARNDHVLQDEAAKVEQVVLLRYNSSGTRFEQVDAHFGPGKGWTGQGVTGRVEYVFKNSVHNGGSAHFGPA